MQSIPLTTLYRYLPPDVHLFPDGTVMSIDEAGESRPVPIRYNPNGKPYIEFLDDSAKRFQVWLLRDFYRAFRGSIPENFEVFAIDGNRSNLSPSNLEVRPRTGLKSKFRLAVPPTVELPPAA